MPELPEVETTRAAWRRTSSAARSRGVVLRRPDLRWPIPPEVGERTARPADRRAIRRRAKYLLLDTAAGSALLHLGMSGSLRVLPASTPVSAHDHVDLVLSHARGEPPGCCASTTRAASAACSGSRRAKPTNCCATSARSRCRTTSTATTCSRAAAAAARRSRPS